MNCEGLQFSSDFSVPKSTVQYIIEKYCETKAILTALFGREHKSKFTFQIVMKDCENKKELNIVLKDIVSDL